MRYNLSEIMTRAWNIKRNENTTMSAALTKSWAIAKASKAYTLTGSEKQIAWATDLLDKMIAELTACKAIAPKDFHATLDAITDIMTNAYAGDVIDLLSSNKAAGQKYFVSFMAAVKVTPCESSKAIRALQ